MSDGSMLNIFAPLTALETELFELYEDFGVNLLEDVLLINAVDSGPVGFTLVEIPEQLFLNIN